MRKNGALQLNTELCPVDAVARTSCHSRAEHDCTPKLSSVCASGYAHTAHWGAVKQVRYFPLSPREIRRQRKFDIWFFSSFRGTNMKFTIGKALRAIRQYPLRLDNGKAVRIIARLILSHVPPSMRVWACSHGVAVLHTTAPVCGRAQPQARACLACLYSV
jgi:hypothetical protein